MVEVVHATSFSVTELICFVEDQVKVAIQIVGITLSAVAVWSIRYVLFRLIVDLRGAPVFLACLACGYGGQSAEPAAAPAGTTGWVARIRAMGVIVLPRLRTML